jgi:hypothetical protein
VTKRILKLVLYNCLVLVLFLVACEAAATAVKSVQDSYKFRQLVRQTAQAGASDQADVAGFLKEQDRAMRLSWTPYTYWRRAPVSGKYVNVDANGIRRTWNPPGPSSPRIRVFMFGGSTMWGTGSRDDYTIPSELSKSLAGSFGSAVEVVNFGEAGYVQTQEMIAFLKEIQRGNVPAVAVFYDGYNDAFAAFQSGVAGTPQNEFNRVREFNLLTSGPRFYLEWVRQSNLFLMISGVTARMRETSYFSHRSGGPDAAPSQGQSSHLIGDVLGIYGADIRMLKALGAEYNIKTLYYWQPSVYTKATLAPGEQAQASSDPSFASFYRATVARLKDSPLPNSGSFRDLTGAFDQHPERVFIDTMHVSERGNAQIAALIAADVAGVVRQLLQRPPGTVAPAAHPDRLNPPEPRP